MDPITAWGLATKAVAELLTEIVKGQSPEYKAKAWEQWQKDVTVVRKFLKIDG